MESSRAFGSQATPYTDTTLYLRWAFQNKLYYLQKTRETLCSIKN